MILWRRVLCRRLTRLLPLVSRRQCRCGDRARPIKEALCRKELVNQATIKEFILHDICKGLGLG